MNLDDELENEVTRWKVAIGSFIVAFGKIEWFTYSLLSMLPSENIFGSVADLGFSRRVSLIKTLINERIDNEELKRKTLDVLDKASDLSNIRNTIAHNSLELTLYDGMKGIDVRHTISKYKQVHDDKKKNEITIDKLEYLCERINDIAFNCSELEGDIDRYLYDKLFKP